MGISESLQAKIARTVREMISQGIDTVDVAGADIFVVVTKPEQADGTIPVGRIEQDNRWFYVFQKGH